MRILRIFFISMALLGGQQAFSANEGLYPDIPQKVQIIVPLAAGNPVDGGARALAVGLAEETGKSFIVINKPGAGGTIGTAEAARGPADGSVLLITSGGHTTNPGLYRNLPYDTVADFKPISLLSRSQGFVLLVHKDSPFKTLQELLDAARKEPESLTYGSFGTGNTTHIVGALFAKHADVQLLHVPYANPVNDFLGGHVDMIFIGTSSARPLIESGRVRGLAVSSERRLDSWPDMPTFRENGLEEAEVAAYTGLYAPAGIPEKTVAQIHAAIKIAVTGEAYQNLLKVTGSDVVVSTPEEFGPYVEKEVALYKKLLPELGIKLD